jgi:hypothetical protein
MLYSKKKSRILGFLRSTKKNIYSLAFQCRLLLFTNYVASQYLQQDSYHRGNPSRNLQKSTGFASDPQEFQVLTQERWTWRHTTARQWLMKVTLVDNVQESWVGTSSETVYRIPVVSRADEFQWTVRLTFHNNQVNPRHFKAGKGEENGSLTAQPLHVDPEWGMTFRAKPKPKSTTCGN